jgi:hypothetical protein
MFEVLTGAVLLNNDNIMVASLTRASDGMDTINVYLLYVVVDGRCIFFRDFSSFLSFSLGYCT